VKTYDVYFQMLQLYAIIRHIRVIQITGPSFQTMQIQFTLNLLDKTSKFQIFMPVSIYFSKVDLCYLHAVCVSVNPCPPSH
jgi:hypothetical protein